MVEMLVAEIDGIRTGEGSWSTLLALAEQAPGETEAYMTAAVDYLTMVARSA